MATSHLPPPTSHCYLGRYRPRPSRNFVANTPQIAHSPLATLGQSGLVAVVSSQFGSSCTRQRDAFPLTPSAFGGRRTGPSSVLRTPYSLPLSVLCAWQRASFQFQIISSTLLSPEQANSDCTVAGRGVLPAGIEAPRGASPWPRVRHHCT